MASAGSIPVVRVLQERDFRAGLNLRADAFALGEGETPDVLNMDFDPRGGFRMRKCYAPLALSALPTTAHSMFPFSTSTGTAQVLVGANKYTYYSTGTDFTSIGTTWTSTNPQRAVTFNDLLYIQNGVDAPRKWTGAAVSNLTQTFIDDLTTSTDGNMPIAKCVTAHSGYVWIANTTETATAFKNRVRWSHPNKPERWRTNDYIDIDVGHDGDEITALVPFQNRLLVFKRNSLYVISGYSPDTFQVLPLSQTAGAVSQEAVIQSEAAVYFFSWPDGCYAFDGKGLTWLFERLSPAVWDGQIPDAYASGATVGWLNRKLHVSVPWGASTVNARTFVYDPTLGKLGGWTAYGNGFGPMLEWRRNTTTKLQLGVSASPQARVMKLNQNADADTWLTDYVTLSGSSGAYAWAPDSANVSPVGDLTIQVYCALTDWTPAAACTLIAKWETTGNQRSWALRVNTSGTLELDTSADGTTALTHVSTVSTGITDGTAKWVRATIDVVSGANRDIKFYTSDDAVTWTQLGATVTVAATTSIKDSTARVTVGARGDAGTAENAIGKFYAAGFSADLTYTDVRANPNFTRQASSVTTTFSDTAGTPNTWTMASLTPSGLSGNVSTYYKTRWFDAGNASVQKRWRRPELVMDDDYTATIRVDAFRNYNPIDVYRSFTLTTTATSIVAWGAFSWGSGVWSAGVTGAQQVSKGHSLGTGRAVQLLFNGPSTSARWGVNALNLKYVARRVR